MTNHILHTPEGVRDIFNGEYLDKLNMLSRIREVIFNKGYMPISTPTFEYFDTFNQDIGSTSSTDMFKMFDRSGHTLVLRPDITPSIARAAAMYFAEDDFPVRLSYEGNVFTNHHSHQGRLKESTQVGCEFIGDSSIEADSEIITTAVQSLKASGLNNFKIIVGHAGIVKGLMNACGLNEIQQTKLTVFINNNNYYGAISYLKELGIETRFIELFDILGKVYSCPSEWDLFVQKVKPYKDVYESATYLGRLDGLLNTEGVKEYISYELDMVTAYKYYTGVIFDGYTYGVGEPVVKGGRYDLLLSLFGKDAPAIGFAIYADQLLEAIKNSDKNNGYLTFALGKGRLAKQTLALFEEIGITMEEMKDPNTRKLIFRNDELKLQFFLSKGPDVPTYVEYGAADIGVVGEDTILEENRNIYEVLDLGFGKCRMCVCGPHEAAELLKHHGQIRVASKYPRIAQDYFNNQKHQTVEIIKLNGSIELAPIVGLSEVIVDIVETGSTLRENGLEVLDTVCPLSARMVVNPVSMKMEHVRITELISKIQKALEAKEESK